MLLTSLYQDLFASAYLADSEYSSLEALATVITHGMPKSSFKTKQLNDL